MLWFSSLLLSLNIRSIECRERWKVFWQNWGSQITFLALVLCKSAWSRHDLPACGGELFLSHGYYCHGTFWVLVYKLKNLLLFGFWMKNMAVPCKCTIICKGGGGTCVVDQGTETLFGVRQTVKLKNFEIQLNLFGRYVALYALTPDIQLVICVFTLHPNWMSMTSKCWVVCLETESCRSLHCTCFKFTQKNRKH